MQRRAFRYRIYPNVEQQVLAVQFGHARFVYNWGLATRKAHYQEHGAGLSYYALKRQLTAPRSLSGFERRIVRYCKPNSKTLTGLTATSLRNGVGIPYPRFKSRKHEQKIRYPQRFKLKGNRIYLPKVGWVKVVFHRPLEGTAKTKSGQYFVSVQREMTHDSRPHGTGEISVDLGLKHFAGPSNGQKVEHPHYLRQSERRLKRHQRQLSRKQKGSANREKARLKLAREAERVANQRKDFLD